MIRGTKSGRIKWVGYIACMEKMGHAYEIIVRKPKGKIPLGRSMNCCTSQ
jgi:hypothetical protein